MINCVSELHKLETKANYQRLEGLWKERGEEYEVKT